MGEREDAIKAGLKKRLWLVHEDYEAGFADGEAFASAAQVEAQPDALAALRELVEVKDLKERLAAFNPQFHWTPAQTLERHEMARDYERRQPLAWAAARAAIKRGI